MSKRDLIFGVVLAALLIGYFFLMKAANLYENFNLRFVNVLFYLLVTWLAIRKFYKDNADKKFNYLSGTLAGFKPIIVGVVIFAIFQMIYLESDENLLTSIQERAPMGETITSFTATVYLFFEGLVVGLISSYLMMRIVDERQVEGYEERL